MAKSNFIYSDDNKRYHTQSYHLKKTFGKKVIKVPVDGGFSCPNIDGTVGCHGCIFCLDGSGPNSDKTIAEQYLENRGVLLSKWQTDAFIVYLQTHTNTYAPTPVLERVYREALSLPDVVGLTISTRPDSISDETLDLLERLSGETYLTVEIGLQSIFNRTLRLINRGHTYEDFLCTFEKLRARNIRTTVHLINGLPDESVEEMTESVKTVASLHPFALKLHLLYVERGTPLEQLWRDGKLPYFEREEYVKLLCDQIERIPEDVVIERLTGDGRADLLLSPLWTMKKFAFLDEIDKELERRGSFQGIKV